MKSYAQMVTRLVPALFEDLADAYPSHASCLLLSMTTIMEGFESRGLPFFTIDLPSCSKFLEQSLENRTIGRDRPVYHGHKSSKDDRPLLLHSFWAVLFDECGDLLDQSVEYPVIVLRQVYNFFKKLDMECKPEYTQDSITEFLRIESELPSSHPYTWDSDVPEWSVRRGHPIWGSPNVADPRQGQLALDSQNTILPDLPWEKFALLNARLLSLMGEVNVWALSPKHGPGAIAERGAIKHEFRVWPRKLNNVFPADWFASHDLTDRTESDHEPASRMCAVPKTQKGPRLIATEPSAHQWIQQGLLHWLEDRIKSTPLGLSIDFRSQEYSRAMALEASASGAYATVDLSSASDRLSTRLVEWMFQGNHSLLHALHAARTRRLSIPKGITPFQKGEEQILLRKFATQGSAVIFPVQTIVYTMLGHYALMMAHGDMDTTVDGMRRRAGKLRVFGDDIIISTEAYGYLELILSTVGLKVNQSKSFHKGLFRESCGMDAYNGVSVTPAYVRSIYQSANPESLSSVVECSNNLHKKQYWKTAAALLKTVPVAERKKLHKGRRDVGAGSIFTYVDGVDPDAKKRWSNVLHRTEVLILTVHGTVKKITGTGEASLNQYFTEVPLREITRVSTIDDNLKYLTPSYFAHGQAKRPRHRKVVRWISLNGELEG